MTAPRDNARTDILAAARVLLAEVGPDALSLREVARRAGVSHQAPYHYWKTRQDLLHEFAVEGFADLDASMAEAQRMAAATTSEQLIACGLGYVRFAVATPAIFALMMQRTHVPAGTAVAPSHAARAPWVRIAEAVRAHRQAVGETVGDIDDPAVVLDAQALWAQGHGLSWFAIQGTLGRLAPDDPLRHARAVLERTMGFFSANAGRP